MKRILITRRLLRSCEDKASKLFDANLNSNDELYSQKKFLELSKGCDGILSSLTDKLDADTINKLPETIKIISNFAVGFGNIDVEAAKKKNIAVTNTPDVLTDATAEIAMLLILGACRRANEGINHVRKENWKWSADFLIGKQLTGSRLGILGMGRIGRAVAKLAKSFGMTKPKGALVSKVIPNSPAEKAKLQQGDVILEFDGSDIKKSTDLPLLVGQAKVGKSFKVKIIRNKMVMNIPILLEELPTEDKIASIETKKIIADSISGISVKNLTPNEKNNYQVRLGVIVTNIDESINNNYDLKQGDIITKINK